DCACCIKTIVDNGSSTKSDDLTNVTYRKITAIKPKQSIPCYGLPEIVEEKTIDASGKEILLSKIAYTYTSFGKVLTEEHYDSKDKHRYTIANTYDASERLISTKDGLGNTTTFAYDNCHNLISISGPRKDQLKKITYDLANRPIKITD